MKLSSGDMVALDAKYHTACLQLSTIRKLDLQEKNEFEKHYRVRQATAHTKLVAYINEIREAAHVAPVYSLKYCNKLYTDRLS